MTKFQTKSTTNEQDFLPNLLEEWFEEDIEWRILEKIALIKQVLKFKMEQYDGPTNGAFDINVI